MNERRSAGVVTGGIADIAADGTAMLDVSAIVVTYNSSATIDACLQSLVDQSTPLREIIVVDNGSTDPSVAVVERFRRGVEPTCATTIRVESTGKNLGFGAGVNAAAAGTTSTWLLLVNPDAILHADTVENLVEFATAHPRHGVYGGRSLEADGSVNPRSCFDRMTLWSLTCFATGLSTALPGRRLTDPESLGRWARDTVREVAVVSGALMLIDHDLWRDLRGFDERFFLYAEDADLCERARALDRSPVLVPTARFQHPGGISSASHGAKMTMVQRGKVEYLQTHWSPARADIGVRLLLAGTWLRHHLSHRRPRDFPSPPDTPTWTEVWNRRREWRRGYVDPIAG